MINEIINSNIPTVLSETAQKAYAKIKALILKIFSMLKSQKNEKFNLKKEFDESYLNFAKKLKEEGHEEYHEYMTICEMYSQLINNPKKLISNEEYFKELFTAFDELLCSKINESEEYEKKYEYFLKFLDEKQKYFYNHLAKPSQYYNETVLNEIIHNLSGDINDN